MAVVREFDHIVIGAGSAGAVVARRLVDAGREVAIIEAGGSDDHPDIQVPNRMFNLWESQFDWGFHTVPQEHANGVEVYWPRGKVFGGSSSLYGMVHARGAHIDFDSWAYSYAPGWSWREVLPYFIRSEDHEDGASEYHGVGGPLPVTNAAHPHEYTVRFLEAASQFGLALNRDCNGPEIFGAGTGSVNIKNGRRYSSWTSYIEPIIADPLLTVMGDTLVSRLVFDGLRCVGVVVVENGVEAEYRSRGDVILSAGTLGTPQVLELSGIGREDELARLGIEPRAVLPGVGENLHDHILVPLVYEALRPMAQAQLNLTEAHFFAASDERMLAPDLQPIFVPASLPVRGIETPDQAFTMLAGVIRPVSRGRMWLNSAVPGDAPSFDPRYLAEEQDLVAMESAIEMCRAIAAQPAFDGWRGSELAPGAGAVSTSGIRDWIRSQLLTYHHQVGTARMGLDHLAVVDPELRVHGIDGLRIADCSVMPTVPSANTHAAAVMVGERAADFVLQPDSQRVGAHS